MAHAMNAGFGDGYDVAVIGGSFAGLTAALHIARGRRRVAVFDDARPRNRFAHASHGVIGHDGSSPAEIVAAGWRDLGAYPTVGRIDRAVISVAGQADAFILTDADGVAHRARRVLLAYGMRDSLPDIPGLWACWGVTAVHCPYCHGYELADRPTAVLMTGPDLPHYPMMLSEWTAEVTLLANGHALAAADRERLGAIGVRVIAPAVTRVEETGGEIAAAHLADGSRIPFGALYVMPQAQPASDLAAQLGCRMAEGPMGPYVEVDMMGATSVPGVFAAGDLSRPMPSAPFAISSGAMTGVACHKSLMPHM